MLLGLGCMPKAPNQAGAGPVAAWTLSEEVHVISTFVNPASLSCAKSSWLLLLQVLFLIDPIDEVAIQNLKSYKEKNFVDISKEDLDLG